MQRQRWRRFHRRFRHFEDKTSRRFGAEILKPKHKTKKAPPRGGAFLVYNRQEGLCTHCLLQIHVNRIKKTVSRQERLLV
jgi:hypothetical protein